VRINTSTSIVSPIASMIMNVKRRRSLTQHMRERDSRGRGYHRGRGEEKKSDANEATRGADVTEAHENALSNIDCWGNRSLTRSGGVLSLPAARRDSTTSTLYSGSDVYVQEVVLDNVMVSEEDVRLYEAFEETSDDAASAEE
jgi:hypothetical protein